MTALDALDLDRLDPSGMLATVERSPAMWRAAVGDLGSVRQAALGRPAAVVVAGMGGSGIVGDVAVLAAERSGRVPVTTVKGYELPGWVSDEHLVVGVSYSGDTEETLAVVAAAAERGCPIVVVTSGGTLGRHAIDRAWFSVPIPAGLQPRASLPHLAIPVLGVLEAVGGLAPGSLDGLDGVADRVEAVVRNCGGGQPSRENPAKTAALALHGKVPVFYGGRGVGALVALRAKCQVNENAGTHAFWNEVPERDHNEVVAWSSPTGPLAVVHVRSPDDEPAPLRRRFRAAADELPGPVLTVPLEGPTWLARLAAGVAQVDLTSVYLAFLSGVDPTPIEPIDRLKRRIAPEADRA